MYEIVHGSTDNRYVRELYWTSCGIPPPYHLQGASVIRCEYIVPACFHEVILHSRGIGACLIPTDEMLAKS